MSPGTAETHHSVHVRPIQVDLAPRSVHDRADFANALLEDAVGRWVGDHQRGQLLTMLLRLGAEIGEIHIAPRVGFTTTTRRPAMMALAGLVPWADCGIRHTVRERPSPRAS